MLIGSKNTFFKIHKDVLVKDQTILTLNIHDGYNEFKIDECSLASGSSAFTVDFGDKQKATYTSQSEITHTYSKQGTYTVIISNDLKKFRIGGMLDTNINNRYIVTSIQKIGSAFTELPQHFCRELFYCSYLDASNANFTTCSNAEFYAICPDNQHPRQGHIILPASLTRLGPWTFEHDRGIQYLTFMGMTAPTGASSSTFGASGNYIGQFTKDLGVNELRIHRGATGYQDGQFGSQLLNSSQCNFHIVYID